MSEFEILADELGAVAGQIERESRLKITTCISDLERRDAEREARVLRLEQELRDKASAVKDGVNGLVSIGKGPPTDSVHTRLYINVETWDLYFSSDFE